MSTHSKSEMRRLNIVDPNGITARMCELLDERHKLEARVGELEQALEWIERSEILEDQTKDKWSVLERIRERARQALGKKGDSK